MTRSYVSVNLDTPRRLQIRLAGNMNLGIPAVVPRPAMSLLIIPHAMQQQNNVCVSQHSKTLLLQCIIQQQTVHLVPSNAS